jgi:hypothetical protein
MLPNPSRLINFSASSRRLNVMDSLNLHVWAATVRAFRVIFAAAIVPA